jgi:solute:Na+ symporter, SSS family
MAALSKNHFRCNDTPRWAPVRKDSIKVVRNVSIPGMSASNWLGEVDWVVIAAYIGGLLTIGLLLSRRPQRSVDYFLASRSTRWPVIGLAMLASNISPTALVGLAGGAYAIGICVYDYEWSAIFLLVFFCVFMVPLVLRRGNYTMPEFLERRYDHRVRLYFAMLTLFLNLFVDSAGVIYSGSLVCQLILPSWPLTLIALVLAGAAGTYTILGGLRAVIYTESIQAVVLMLSALLISIEAFARAGGWHAVMTAVDPAALSLIRPASDPGVPWPGLVTGIPLLGFYYWCTNQNIVQRVLSARDEANARWGMVFVGFLKLPVLFVLVLPGICALLLFPHLPHSDSVYPKLILELMPSGLLGLVVAGFIAATMVSCASMVNSASSLITMDVIKHHWPTLSDTNLVRIGRLSSAGLLLFAVAWAPQLQHFGSLWQYLQAVLAYAVPPVVSIFLVGLFWRGATCRGAAMTMRLGSCLGFAAFCINVVLRWTHLHFLYVTTILFLIDSVMLVAVSLQMPEELTSARSEVIWTPQLMHAEQLLARARPVWQDYRLQAAVLVMLVTIVVYVFR